MVGHAMCRFFRHAGRMGAPAFFFVGGQANGFSLTGVLHFLSTFMLCSGFLVFCMSTRILMGE